MLINHITVWKVFWRPNSYGSSYLHLKRLSISHRTPDLLLSRLNMVWSVQLRLAKDFVFLYAPFYGPWKHDIWWSGVHTVILTIHWCPEHQLYKVWVSYTVYNVYFVIVCRYRQGRLHVFLYSCNLPRARKVLGVVDRVNKITHTHLWSCAWYEVICS